MKDLVDSAVADGSRGEDPQRLPSGFGVLALTQTRPVGVFMVTIAVVTFGMISLGKLPVNLMPDFSYPTLTVRTEYPGTAPGDTFSIIGLNDNQPSRRVTRESERAVLSGTGGLY